MGVGQVRYVVATGSALVPSLAPYLQRRLLSLNSMLLAMLGLLQGGVWLQDDSIHSATQRVVSPLGKRVHNRGWSHCMLLLLPRLRHLPLRMQGLSTREMTGEFQSQTERMVDVVFKNGNELTDKSSVQYLCLHVSSETRGENLSCLAVLFTAVFGLWSKTVGVFWTRRTSGGRDAVEAGRHPLADGRTPETATQRAVAAVTAILC